VEGPPEILDALSTEKRLRLLPVWVSLQSKEQFVDRATALVRKEVRARWTGGWRGQNAASGHCYYSGFSAFIQIKLEAASLSGSGALAAATGGSGPSPAGDLVELAKRGAEEVSRRT